VVGRPEGDVSATSVASWRHETLERAGRHAAGRASGMFFRLMTTVNGAPRTIFSAT